MRTGAPVSPTSAGCGPRRKPGRRCSTTSRDPARRRASRMARSIRSVPARRRSISSTRTRWAAFLTDPEVTEEDVDSEIVRVGTPLADGLPRWAADELAEAAGARGPVVGLVEGRLVGLGPDQD